MCLYLKLHNNYSLNSSKITQMSLGFSLVYFRLWTIFLWVKKLALLKLVSLYKWRKYILGVAYKFNLSFKVSFSRYLGNPLHPYPIPTSSNLYDIIQGFLNVLHFLFSKQALTDIKRAEILLAKLTPTLKIRWTTRRPLIIICFFWLVLIRPF